MIKSHKILWSDKAKKELSEIISYISEDSIKRAKEINTRINKSIKKLSLTPFAGRVVPEMERFNIEKYREVILTPWRIVYHVESSRVIIISILDSRRDLEEILYRKLISD